MMSKAHREAWTRLVDLSTSSRWFDGVILAADAELTALRQQRDELLTTMKAIKKNLMHQRRFGTDAIQNWTRAATTAEGDIEEAIAKAEGITP